jgi:hypothetical protein
MIKPIIRDLERCRSDHDFWRIQIKAETKLTPREIRELVERMDRLPAGARPWLTYLSKLLGSAGGPPQRYKREAWDPNVDYFTDPSAPRSGKVLIIGFSGNADRLMIPIGCVLQFLPSRRFDLVVLRDATHSHYLNGAGDYAPTVHGLAKRLTGDFKPRKYAKVFCFGTSMGGFGALRCGVLIRADRAISVGGRFHWHIRRLLHANEAAVSAFDPLCECFAQTRTGLICAYSAGNEEDRVDVERLAAILPIQRMALSNATDHNLIFALLKENRLRQFFDEVFELERTNPRPLTTG